MDIKELLELNKLAKKDGEKYPKKRFSYQNLISFLKTKQLIGIVGPRGVGKTVLLKQILTDYENSFYISADTIEEDLFSIIKLLQEKYKVKIVLIDEIHFKENFEKDLKKIFDFLNVKVFFTSSRALSLFYSSYDLSRRVNLFQLYPFSIREYIYFKERDLLEVLSIQDIVEKKGIEKHLLYEYLFEDYLKGDLYPFALEEISIIDILKNILNTIIYRDIPAVTNLQVKELKIIEKIIRFVAKSPVDGINYSSVAKNLGITKYKAEQYINLLENSFVLNVIFPEGTNVLKEPKILMNLPFRLIFKDFSECIGELREDFFVEMLKMIGIEFYYLKTKRGAKTPDYIVKSNNKEIIFEIGGKGKGKTQFKGIQTKLKIILTHPGIINSNKLPLFLIGFLN